ncbi:MOSC domain-containing protein [Xanthocytophaga flava]|uniref:MOSC domain-containing protein n=1 Tax=Xanthocytophaga flava TaxID=3048013 RepID=UPI0028D6FA8D|nr:MOSC N-terminal beta barrel domain-containing protein [Xanthocytophaga flavus]
MDTLHLSAIYIYPIKSLGGFSVTESSVEERGLKYDRRWMLVDENNKFLTQRSNARLALLQVSISNDSLLVTHKHTHEKIAIPLQPQTSEHLQVQVWDDICEAVVVDSVADTFFSDYMGSRCRLVYMPDSSIRPVDPRYAVTDNYTSFSDAYPFLMIGQASLDDLNGKLEEKLPMNRFRPNLVISGGTPYAEESWREIQIGEAHFYGVKPCARCVVTTTDQQTAKVGKEPLRTLATYRKVGNKILFGQNLVFGRKGSAIRVGDLVSISSVNG